MDDLQLLQKSIVEYMNIVLTYFKIEEQLQKACTPQNFREAANRANLYLSDEDLERLEHSALRALILQEYKNLLLDITYGYLSLAEKEDGDRGL